MISGLVPDLFTEASIIIISKSSVTEHNVKSEVMLMHFPDPTRPDEASTGAPG